MSEYINLGDLDKGQLLQESKTFCMFPWTHLNATPKGDIYPCCSNDYSDPVGNTRDMSLAEAFNTDRMKQLRLDMLAGKQNKICDFCYKHEQSGPYSFRTYSLEHFGKYFDESLAMTHTDGAVDEFKMRYFDIRFSNICNFKCRTCGGEFSSQWAIEDKKTYKPDGEIIIHVDSERGDILKEVIDQVEHIDLAYFAGGEPLITPEHYVILEELIRAGKTSTILRYNTNASTISYKDKDIFELWSHFDKVEVSCSIDHYGERAELLRHGTKWGRVEANMKKFRELEHIDFQLNTVFSIFNYQTLPEFYQYMHDAGLVSLNNDWYHSLYQAVHPAYYCARALPAPMKLQAAENIRNWDSGTGCITRLVNDAITFADQEHTWDTVKDQVFHNFKRLDTIRGENLYSVFPELQQLEQYR
jgi:MoaA/NifB/PqqE/SkfB family radical SAM enzyme